jgi:hypothetical protein
LRIQRYVEGYATGAGNIEVPGAYDSYTFSGTAGDSIFIDKISHSGTNNIYYSLIDPSGTQLDWHYLYNPDMGTVELPETGTYTLLVGNSTRDQTGTYSISISNAVMP